MYLDLAVEMIEGTEQKSKVLKMSSKKCFKTLEEKKEFCALTLFKDTYTKEQNQSRCDLSALRTHHWTVHAKTLAVLLFHPK